MLEDIKKHDLCDHFVLDTLVGTIDRLQPADKVEFSQRYLTLVEELL